MSGRLGHLGPEGSGHPLLYLDQFVWIELARARLGRSSREEFSDLRRHLHDALRAELVSAPLSHVHYLENWRQGSERRRGEVAAEMATLSRFLTLAPVRVVLPVEIDRAVRQTFSRDANGASTSVLGLGAAHAFGYPEMQPDVVLSAEDRFIAEWGILAGLGAGEYEEEERRRHAAEKRFAETETERARLLKPWAKGAFDAQQRLRITGLADLDRMLCGSLIANDVSIEEFAQLGPNGMELLCQQIPIAFTLTELRRIRSADASARLRRTDLNDLRALAMAIPYCDVVVTDKAWASMIRRTDLEARFGTVVARDLGEALEALPSARAHSA